MEENRKSVKRNNLSRFMLNLGKLVLDATKLTFASLVLGAVIKGDIPQSTLLIVGIIVSIFGAILGITLIIMCEEK